MVPLISIIIMIFLPAFAISKEVRHRPVKRPYLYACGSFLFCIWGIISEIITIKERLFAADIGGIEDTIGAVILICVIMMVIAITINALLLGISYEHEDRN